MARLSPLSLPEAQRLGAEYDLDVVSVTPMEAGSVNSNFRLGCRSGPPVFARIYEEQDTAGACAEIQLLTELAQLGVATPSPVTRTDGSLTGSVGGKPFSIYPWVEGQWLCHQRLTPLHCRMLGRTLAQVHLATPRLSAIPAGRFGIPQVRQRLADVRQTTPRLNDDVDFIERGLAKYLTDATPGLPTGLIHGDLFRDNVLWSMSDSHQSPTISALLDFESASHGVFVYDLMVCVLSWCFTATFDIERARAMVDGYTSSRALSPLERRAACTEGQAACLRFATTRITDFELRATTEQPPARDFRRFLLRYEALAGGGLGSVFGG